MEKSNAAFLVALGCTVGCATQPAPRYFQAQPLREPPRPPAVVTVAQPMPLPGQLRPVPPPNRPAAPAARPCVADPAGKRTAKHTKDGCNDVASVIDRANAKAIQNPDEAGFFNAITTYTYDPGALYQIYAAPLRLTTISLQPGERIMDKPAAGDATRWILGFGRSKSGQLEQQHLYVRPSRPGLDTSMVITTDRRTYHVELHSFDTTYMAAVAWRYPQDEIADFERLALDTEQREKAVTASLDLSSAYFRYEVKVLKGKPRWTPEQVFDDGRRTYIRFPKSMINREAPALFVLSSSKEIQLVNYRVRNEYYLVDRVFDAAELRIGQKSQDIVRITRK